MTLGEQLKELRKNNGLSQEKVAEAVGVSKQVLPCQEKVQRDTTLQFF